MVTIQPIEYEHTTNIYEHNQMVNKINEIIEKLNGIVDTSAIWGNIDGNISDQLDLKDELDNIGYLLGLVNDDIDNLTLSLNNLNLNKADKTELSEYQKILSAGVGISIVNNVVSCTVPTFSIEIVEQLPLIGENHKIYLVASMATGNDNNYDEYIYINHGWEKIGTTEIDLSNYYTKSQTDSLLNNKSDKSTTYTKTQTDSLLNNKSDKSTTYTKTETNTLLNNKSDKSTTYTKIQTDTLLNNKVNTFGADDIIFYSNFGQIAIIKGSDAGSGNFISFSLMTNPGVDFRLTLTGRPDDTCGLYLEKWIDGVLDTQEEIITIS